MLANAHEMILSLPQGCRPRLAAMATNCPADNASASVLRARSLVIAGLILLDEPNSDLDPDGEEA